MENVLTPDRGFKTIVSSENKIPVSHMKEGSEHNLDHESLFVSDCLILLIQRT